SYLSSPLDLAAVKPDQEIHLILRQITSEGVPELSLRLRRLFTGADHLEVGEPLGESGADLSGHLLRDDPAQEVRAVVRMPLDAAGQGDVHASEPLKLADVGVLPEVLVRLSRARKVGLNGGVERIGRLWRGARRD